MNEWGSFSSNPIPGFCNICNIFVRRIYKREEGIGLLCERCKYHPIEGYTEKLFLNPIVVPEEYRNKVIDNRIELLKNQIQELEKYKII